MVSRVKKDVKQVKYAGESLRLFPARFPSAPGASSLLGPFVSVGAVDAISLDYRFLRIDISRVPTTWLANVVKRLALYLVI
jgi:hypothetical protein